MLHKGESIPVELTVKDDAGNLLKLSSFHQILCDVCTESGAVLDKGSKIYLTGYDSTKYEELDQSSNTGECIFYIDKNHSQHILRGRLVIYLSLFSTSQKFDNNEQKTEITIIRDVNGDLLYLSDHKQKDA